MIHEYTSRRADTEQQLLGRSMPLSTSAPITSGHELSRDEKREFTPQRRMAIILPLRGRSSAGRARRSQCRGRGFDPLRLHHQYSGRRLFVGLVFSHGLASRRGCHVPVTSSAGQAGNPRDEKSRVKKPQQPRLLGYPGFLAAAFARGCCALVACSSRASLACSSLRLPTTISRGKR